VKKPLIVFILVVWLAAFASTLIFRENKIANVALLVVSLGLIILGLLLRKKN